MGCITFLILLFCIGIMVVVDIFFWMSVWQLGLAGVFGIIAFFIAYGISVEMSIAPREFWTNCEFDIFLKKLGYGWSVMVATWLIVYVILACIWPY